MKNSILLIVLALFFSLNISGCSLFSSDEEEAETATMAEAGETGEGGDEFASDEFEMGDAKGADFESDDFDAEAMAKNEGPADIGDLAGEDVEVEDNFGDEYPDEQFGDAAAPKTAATDVEGIGGDDLGDGWDDGDEFGDELGGDVAATTAAAGGAAAGDGFKEDYIDDDAFADVGDEIEDNFGDTETVAADDSLFVDEGGGIPDSTMSANQEQDLFGTDTLDPVVDTPSYSGGYDSGYGTGFDEPAGMGMSGLVPVKKMKAAAYKRSGGNVNRLYVVRPGDNMDNIAEKIYGSSAQAEKLYSYNSHHRGRTLDVGDKVYYESPNNPNDPSMMTYYEDVGSVPSYYTSQEGDNLRKVAKNLLGHERSWMEIYATNENVESKSRIPAGLQIRYWPEGAATQTLAMNDPEPAPAMPDPEPIEEMPVEEPIAMDEPAEMPSMDEPADVPAMDEPAEMADLDDPAALEDPEDLTPPPAMGQTGNPPSPPPMAKQPVAPPPAPPVKGPKPMNKPAPPKVAGNPVNDPLAAISGDDNMIMGALGGLLLLAAIIMLIFIRRSRAKRVNFSQTQV